MFFIFTLLLVTLSLGLCADVESKKDGVYESRKELSTSKKILKDQKNNLNKIYKNLNVIDKKRSYIQKTIQNQKEILIKSNKNLKAIKKSLKIKQQDLKEAQAFLKIKIKKLHEQTLLLAEEQKRLSTERKNLKAVLSRITVNKNILLDLKKQLSEQKTRLKVKDETIEQQYNYIVAIVIFTIIFVLLLIYTYFIRQKELKTYKQLQELKENLELRIAEATKEQKLLQKQKITSMHELIGNIAHQWRQPLGVISAVCSNLSMKLMLNPKVEKDFFIEELGHINNQSQHLSKTIDIFRDYIKGEKIYKKVVLQSELTQAYVISDGVLKAKFIDVKDNTNYVKPIEISLVTGELPQVLINIINNSKDALIKNKIVKPLIEYDLIQKDNLAIVTIEDNAGGIPEDIMLKIFDPYFTTKSEGTGLGLHMSYKIITESLKGHIYAENTKKGVKFFIELPLS